MHISNVAQQTISPPKTNDELMTRVNSISGLTLGEAATLANTICPDDLKHHKGWVGQLIEKLLGASASSKPEPDFEYLGIELKTLPLSKKGEPLETTYVCALNLLNVSKTTFFDSTLYKKLKHVLWLPIEADNEIPLANRRIGQGQFWQPSENDLTILQGDWQMLTDLIAFGRIDEISAHMGEVLQIRPKAANSKALTAAFGPDGQKIMTLPRGFYLRAHFTKSILEARYAKS